jgi:DNA-binding FadR family transcriptional regulator
MKLIFKSVPKPSDRLLSEIEIAQQFNVGRRVVRFIKVKREWQR